MTLPITSIYAALSALIFLTLSIRVITYRRANTISLGDSGDKNLLKRMRAQANCAEYAPLALILLMLSEFAAAPSLALHMLGVMLVAGRALHAFGFASTPQKIIFRQVGILMNMAMIVFAALGLLGHALL